MISIWAERARSLALKPRRLLLCLAFFGATACRAQSREHERKLTELDKEYLAPEAPRANERRHKCAGMDQLATLKGEWVRTLQQVSIWSMRMSVGIIIFADAQTLHLMRVLAAVCRSSIQTTAIRA